MSMTKIRGQQIDLDSTQGIDVEANGKLFIKLLSGTGIGFDGSGELECNTDGVSVDTPDGTNLSVVGFQNVTSDVSGIGVWYRTDTTQFKKSNNNLGHNPAVFLGSLDHLNSLSGTAISNTTTETDFQVAGTTRTYTFLNGFWQQTVTLRIRATFILNTLLAVTLRLRAYLGTTVVVDSGAFTTAASLSNAVVVWEFQLTCRTPGSSGNTISTGIVNLGTTTSVAGASHRSGSVSVNLATDLDFKMTGQLGTASASDNVAIETWDILQLA